MSDEGSPRWARIVGGVGKGLIAAGVLILLFVVYQLWGTDLQEASSQSDLKSRFNHELSESPVLSAPTTTVPITDVPITDVATTDVATTAVSTTAAPTSTTTPAFVTEIHPGDPVARLEIDKIGVDKIVVAGTDTADLRKGPGIIRTPRFRASSVTPRSRATARRSARRSTASTNSSSVTRSR